MIKLLSRGWRAAGSLVTPRSHFDEQAFREQLARRAHAAQERGFTLAYSVKTNPSLDVLRSARSFGLLAEANNGAECHAATTAGWKTSDLILDGPGKRWPTSSLPRELFALICESPDEFIRSLNEEGQHRFVGFRIRTPGVESRMGLDMTDRVVVDGAITALRTARSRGVDIVMHAHRRGSSYGGMTDWWTSMTAVVKYARELAEASRTTIRCLDLGGGFDQQGLDTLLFSTLGNEVVEHVRCELPGCGVIVLEPGKSLVATSGVVYSRVLVRRSPTEVIVDASVAELPWPAQTSRPVFCLRAASGSWFCLPAGDGLIAGRTSMETDVLVREVDTQGLSEGDIVAFGEAGAYDTSLRSSFATGTVLPPCSEWPSAGALPSRFADEHGEGSCGRTL